MSKLWEWRGGLVGEMKLSATVSVSRVECSGNSLRNEDVHDQQDTLSRPARLAQPWHKQKLRDQGHPAICIETIKLLGFAVPDRINDQ